VFENLTLGDASIPEAAVFEAATIAGIDAFVRSLPQGYQTLLGHSSAARGTQLSAGQQQLLALARALVHKPAVLLLDEATAAIDGISDAAFRAALRQSVLPAGCAVLTVAHRLSTAVEADRVIVFERGAIVEEGTPGELTRRAGRFAALLELEAAGWDWRSGP
jgi:ATP-binding cassette subfamily B multidrug efflux pump